MKKVELNKKKKQDALLNTAYQLFTEKGFQKTSISDIVNEAGVAKGTFYLYFSIVNLCIQIFFYCLYNLI